MQTSCNFTKTIQMFVGDFYICLKRHYKKADGKKGGVFTQL